MDHQDCKVNVLRKDLKDTEHRLVDLWEDPCMFKRQKTIHREIYLVHRQEEFQFKDT